MIKEIIDSVRNAFSFASYTRVTSSNGIEINPISETVKDMNTRPKYKIIDGYEYLKFGNADDTDLMIDRMSYKSATHAGILTKKSKMLSGIGLEVETGTIGQKNAKIMSLMKHAGGAGVTLYDVITRAGYEYIRSGAVGLIINFDKPGKNKIPDGIITIEVVPARNMRFERPTNDLGVYTHMIVKKSFKNGADVPKARRIPIFNPFNPAQGEHIIYIKNPYSVLDSYGLPNWIGAYHFIEADYEFGLQIENSAKNGFAPKVHVTMTGRNMTEEEKMEAANNIQTRLSGSDGDQVVVSFVGRMEEKPEIDSLDIQNLDKTIDVMAQLNDAKILTSHNITSPALFGVVTNNKMGGTGTEMLSAYKMFKATETEPDRRMIIDAIELAFQATELKDVKFVIEDYEVDVEYKTKPVEGGNTEDNPNVKNGNENE